MDYDPLDLDGQRRAQEEADRRANAFDANLAVARKALPLALKIQTQIKAATARKPSRARSDPHHPITRAAGLTHQRGTRTRVRYPTTPGQQFVG